MFHGGWYRATLIIVVVVATLTLECAAHTKTKKIPRRSPVYGVTIIVRNEIVVLPRLFESLRPYISHYTVCDTGSTDGTQDYVKKYLKDNGLAGTLYQDDWIDLFSYSRNKCLRRARRDGEDVGVDFILLVDADFMLIVKDEEQFHNEEPPYDYNLIAYTGSLHYRQGLLVRRSKRCGYLGDSHEYLTCVDNKRAYGLMQGKELTTNERMQVEAASRGSHFTRGNYDGIVIYHALDGSNRAEKFHRDVRIFTKSLKRDPDNTRDWFYLARSHEDLGHYSMAFDAYYKRMMMGGFKEEVWYCGFKLGVTLLKNGTGIEDAARYLIDAFNFMPERREPLLYLARHYRLRGKYSACKLFGLHAIGIPFPTNHVLFVDRHAYEWRLEDELSQCLHWLGESKAAIILAKRILKRNPSIMLPVDKARVEDNLLWFEGKHPPVEEKK